MNIKDFVNFKINNFLPDEITATGAHLKDVVVNLMVAYQKYRLLMDRPIVLLQGGLTTGKHYSPMHPAGLAGDSTFQDDHPVSFKRVYRAAMDAGFTGIGIYHNGAAYSVHLDLRPNHVHWVGWKRHRETKWHYEYNFMVDPKLFATETIHPKELRGDKWEGLNLDLLEDLKEH